MELGSIGKVSEILQALDHEGRQKFSALSERRSVAAGTVLFREGEAGDEFFVLARGRLRVTAADLGTEKEIAVLEHGSFFGEGALVGSQKRGATVTALEDSLVVAFRAPAVDALLQAYPKAREVLNHVALARTEATLEKLSSN